MYALSNSRTGFVFNYYFQIDASITGKQNTTINSEGISAKECYEHTIKLMPLKWKNLHFKKRCSFFTLQGQTDLLKAVGQFKIKLNFETCINL